MGVKSMKSRKVMLSLEVKTNFPIKILKEAASQERWQGIFKTIEEEVVSSDLIGDLCPSIADLSFTRVIDKDLVKVLVWYDNEMGYAAGLVNHVIKAGQNL